MSKVSEIINKLEAFAPPELAEKWDNSGWQVNLNNEESKKVMVALSVTEDVVEQAKKQGCDLIISHHPVIFSKLGNINSDIVSQKPVIEAIKNNIQIYSLHTNLDKTENGTLDLLCENLGLLNLKKVNDFMKIGEFEEEMLLDTFILKLKLSLNSAKVKLINPSSIQTLKTVAVCPGAGGDFMHAAKSADVFVTADIKYHNALEVDDFIAIDIGHFESERLILPVLAELIEKSGVETVIAREKSPWIVV